MGRLLSMPQLLAHVVSSQLRPGAAPPSLWRTPSALPLPLSPQKHWTKSPPLAHAPVRVHILPILHGCHQRRSAVRVGPGSGVAASYPRRQPHVAPPCGSPIVAGAGGQWRGGQGSGGYALCGTLGWVGKGGRGFKWTTVDLLCSSGWVPPCATAFWVRACPVAPGGTDTTKELTRVWWSSPPRLLVYDRFAALHTAARHWQRPAPLQRCASPGCAAVLL